MAHRAGFLAREVVRDGKDGWESDGFHGVEQAACRARQEPKRGDYCPTRTTCMFALSMANFFPAGGFGIAGMNLARTSSLKSVGIRLLASKKRWSASVRPRSTGLVFDAFGAAVGILSVIDSVPGTGGGVFAAGRGAGVDSATGASDCAGASGMPPALERRLQPTDIRQTTRRSSVRRDIIRRSECN